MEELKAGEQVQLELCPVYARHTSVKPSLKKSGTFYLWDDKIVNHRIRVTNDKNKVGIIGYITGWVEISNIPTIIFRYFMSKKGFSGYRRRFART